jgi:hypothetical protein
MQLILSKPFVNTVVLRLPQTHTIYYQCRSHNRDGATKGLQPYFQFIVFSSRKMCRFSEKKIDIFAENRLVSQEDFIYYTA